MKSICRLLYIFSRTNWINRCSSMFHFEFHSLNPSLRTERRLNKDSLTTIVSLFQQQMSNETMNTTRITLLLLLVGKLQHQLRVWERYCIAFIAVWKATLEYINQRNESRCGKRQQNINFIFKLNVRGILVGRLMMTIIFIKFHEKRDKIPRRDSKKRSVIFQSSFEICVRNANLVFTRMITTNDSRQLVHSKGLPEAAMLRFYVSKWKPTLDGN